MFLNPYYQVSAQGIRISPQQASRFAKEVAGDFNPIHTPGAKRFCVPGDLLFSLVLNRYGLSQRMCFTFSGMVGEEALLSFPASDDRRFAITDDRDRVCMEVERDGAQCLDPVLIEAFARQYVAFSGQNFPHVLLPLLQSEGVMINPDRPLVIYESMSIQLDRLNFALPVLEHAEHKVKIKGKRADVRLAFDILAEGRSVGAGFKKLVVSGLKPYDEQIANQVVEDYLLSKMTYQQAVGD